MCGIFALLGDSTRLGNSNELTKIDNILNSKIRRRQITRPNGRSSERLSKCKFHSAEVHLILNKYEKIMTNIWQINETHMKKHI